MKAFYVIKYSKRLRGDETRTRFTRLQTRNTPAPRRVAAPSHLITHPIFQPCVNAVRVTSPRLGAVGRALGSLCEYNRTFALHMGQKDRTDPRVSAARGCANAAPAAMPPPTEAREGCSGLMAYG